MTRHKYSGIGFCDGPGLRLFILVGWDRSSFVCCLVLRGSTDDLLLLQFSSGVVWQTGVSTQRVVSVGFSSLLLRCIGRDLFVYHCFLLMRSRVIMRTGRLAGCFVPFQGLRVGLYTWGWLKRPQWFVAGRSGEVVLLWFFVAFFGCRGFGGVSLCVCSFCFSSVCVARWPPFGMLSLCFDCF